MRYSLTSRAVAVCLVLLSLLLSLLLPTPSAAFGPAQPLTIPIAVVSPEARVGFILPALALSVSRRTDEGPLQVVLLARGGAINPDTLATALTHGLPLLGLAPQGLTVTIGVSSRFALSGESITAAVVVGTAAALTQRTWVPGTVITGTVLPSGELGPIGDLAIKAAAASGAGYQLYYPAQQATEAPAGSHIALATIQDAYARLTQ